MARPSWPYLLALLPLTSTLQHARPARQHLTTRASVVPPEGLTAEPETTSWEPSLATHVTKSLESLQSAEILEAFVDRCATHRGAQRFGRGGDVGALAADADAAREKYAELDWLVSAEHAGDGSVLPLANHSLATALTARLERALDAAERGDVLEVDDLLLVVDALDEFDRLQAWLEDRPSTPALARLLAGSPLLADAGAYEAATACWPLRSAFEEHDGELRLSGATFPELGAARSREKAAKVALESSKKDAHPDGAKAAEKAGGFFELEGRWVVAMRRESGVFSRNKTSAMLSNPIVGPTPSPRTASSTARAARGRRSTSSSRRSCRRRTRRSARCPCAAPRKPRRSAPARRPSRATRL